MAFSILVGNDDDNLRNHASCSMAAAGASRRSMSYISTHVGSDGRLILAVGDHGHEATLADALTGAASHGLDREEAETLLEDLRVRVNGRWKAALVEAVSEVDIERFAKCSPRRAK